MRKWRTHECTEARHITLGLHYTISSLFHDRPSSALLQLRQLGVGHGMHIAQPFVPRCVLRTFHEVIEPAATIGRIYVRRVFCATNAALCPHIMWCFAQLRNSTTMQCTKAAIILLSWPQAVPRLHEANYPLSSGRCRVNPVRG